MSRDFLITVEDPRQDEIRAIIADLREFGRHMTADEMAGEDTSVLVARVDGNAVAIGALRRHPGDIGDIGDIGEVKRMYTLPEFRGRGIGGAILADIEAIAIGEGLTRLVLETGNNLPAAWRVYERAGFKRCGPVLDYPGGPLYVFYEKTLAA